MVFGGFVGLMFVPDRTGCRAAKASLHLLGARCISRAARRHSRRQCCAVVRRPMGQGALPGKVCLLGVVAVYGRSLSRWSAVSVWGSRRVCATVCRRISAAVPLRFLEGPSVGTGPFHCQRPVAVGRARVCRVRWGAAVPMMLLWGVFLISARGGLGPWGVSHTPRECAAEGPENLVHKGCLCCLDFRLSAHGRPQLPAHRQRPDLVDRENGAQVGCCGGLRHPLALGDGYQLLPAVQVEQPRRCPVPVVRPAALSSLPEAVEDMSWVPRAGFPRHDGRPGVCGLVLGQG